MLVEGVMLLKLARLSEFVYMLYTPPHVVLGSVVVFNVQFKTVPLSVWALTADTLRLLAHG
jgi:hypothetical protein